MPIRSDHGVSVQTGEDRLGFLRTAGLSAVDPEIARLATLELDRQRQQIELIASENFAWPSVLEALASGAHNKIAEGYPGRRYHGGCEVIDEMERVAIDRAKSLFSAEHANVQPHSGTQANLAVYFACLEPGDVILGMRLGHGGHLTHGTSVNFSGRIYRVVSYGVDRETGLVDLEEVRHLAQLHRPKLIICGGSAYPRTIEAERFRAIADEVGALLLCDMAHVAGLVAAGLHPSPVAHSDFVTSTTNKTLAGPRGAFVLCKAKHAEALDKAVFPGTQGSPSCHAISAKATCFLIAASDAFREYQRQIRANADALAATLIEGGLVLLTGGTDTHLLMVDLRSTSWTGRDAEERLRDVLITVNRNVIPHDERPPTITSGLRIGTAAVTIRGFDENDMREVGEIISAALREEADIRSLRDRSRVLCSRRPLYAGFDGFLRGSWDVPLHPTQGSID
jgi:glycine hydroxymethyltransferase